MCSFRNVRRLLVDAYDDDIIDEDEFVLLYQANTSKNLDFPYKECGQFDLNELDSAECKAEFRFEKHDIELLAQVLDIPDRFVCNQGTVCDGIEGLCIAMKRFAYPCRYSDMIHRFGRPVPELSMICSLVYDFIFDTHGHRITQWNDTILNPINFQRYADATHNKGAALENCIGFIDGTVRQICRPRVLQRIVYNGHKRIHALKFQSVTLPNGIIAHMYGPVGGKKHDSAMLADSGLLNDLDQSAFNALGQPMCLYGDPAYPLRIHLQVPLGMQCLLSQ